MYFHILCLLVLFCPTCPQPGINVYPEATDNLLNQDTDPCSWKYNWTLIMDGNFKAEHLYDRRTDGQVWLMDGLGFMVSWLPYHEYLAASHYPIERSSCNNHKAVNQVNSSHAWLEATGIGAMACACYGCFVPHSVVDFQKGERQVNMDYSLANALQYNMQGVCCVISFYDVNCSYMRKLRQRVGNNDFLKFPKDLEIIPGIGIWHVHGHQPQCFSRYAPFLWIHPRNVIATQTGAAGLSDE
ncbi:hypothetical protein BS17DRAFT_796674 [Gyrodon lividus]|nr:hypothetical protein BS17DRAFT_796674 [Gyrodon lividus]